MPLTQEERLARNLEQLSTKTHEDHQLYDKYNEQWDAALKMDHQNAQPAVLTFYLPTFEHEERLKQRLIDGEKIPEEEFKLAQPIDPVQLDDANSRSVRKKRKAMQKQYKKALISKMEAKTTASNWVMDKMHNEMANHPDKVADGTIQDTVKYTKYHDTIDDGNLELAINSINEIEKSNLAMLDYEKALKEKKKENFGAGDESFEVKTLKFKLDAQYERIRAYRTRSLSLPLNSKKRIKLMKKIEEETLKADHLKREHKVARMPEGPEKQRDADTIKRHDKFDFLKKIFRKPTRFSAEDAELNIAANRQLGIEREMNLINVGRATMGGTKAMYTFVENEANGENNEWLFKEATNCIGMYKPEGAVVTEAASKLQRQVRGNYSIPAKCIKEGDKVVGSIQKKIDAAGGFDLFKWQANPDNSIPPEIKSDLMKEHILDWILCNFDTKGENFLVQQDGHLISFDKEASFNHLLNEEAQHMSYTYKPHSNDTIYNVMFRSFVEGKVDLDFYAAEEAIQNIEAMTERQFIDMFKETLNIKYGEDGPDRERAEQILKTRKRNLREECRNFFTDIIEQRIKAVKDDRNLDNVKKYFENEKLHILLSQDDTEIYNDHKRNYFHFVSESRHLQHLDEQRERIEESNDPNEIAECQRNIENIQRILSHNAVWAIEHPYNPDPDFISNPY